MVENSDQNTESTRRWVRILLFLGCATLFLRWLSEAWIGEDAIITYRVIDNFVNGHGLRWNIDERVQVYTHPLWMLLNACFYAITREIPYTLTAVSLGLSVTAYYLLARRLVLSPAMMFGAACLPILCSKTLIYYGTSGFETPLGYVLLAAFITELIPKEKGKPVPWFRLTLYASLAAVNRLDYILLIAAPMAYLCISQRRQIKWRRLILGATPLVFWLLFSLIYYGSFFPNTAKAKILGQIPLGEYVREGLIYTASLIRWDAAAAPILSLALAIGFGAILRWRHSSDRMHDGLLASLCVSLFLYIAYIHRIGGGFLCGRFWAPVLFTAVAMISVGLPDWLHRLKSSNRIYPGRRLACCVLILLALYAFAFKMKGQVGRGPILDQSDARYYLRSNLTWGMSDVASWWTAQGDTLRMKAGLTDDVYVAKSGVIGFKGFAAGPNVIMIDPLALADPFLAVLPLERAGSWRNGHLPRLIPPGYMHARRTGSPDQMHPSLQEYYRHLRVVVADPIFQLARFRTICDFLRGRYKHLIEEASKDSWVAKPGFKIPSDKVRR